MESTQHLKNAPIREALIDIRVELPENLTAEVFSMLAKEHQGDFPSQGKARRFKAGFEFRDDGKAIAHAAHDASFEGVRLSNENGNEIVQFRTDGFTFNKLKPYTSWDDIYPRAMKFWESYRDKTHPLAVSRLAVRYINSMRFPGRIEELRDYLVLPPTSPTAGPSDLKSFLNHQVLFDKVSGISVNFVQASQGADSKAVTVLMDIDAYKTGSFGEDEKQSQNLFLALREMKNRIFFGSIKEKAKELFNE